MDIQLWQEHSDEAAFLWSQRDLAVDDPLYDFADLRAIDERLEAHLDGLRLAGTAGIEICDEAISNPDREPGDVFTSTVLAVQRSDLERIADNLDVAAASPPLARAMVSALGWVTRDKARSVLSALLSGQVPAELRYIGIAASAVRRNDPGPALDNALLAPEPRLAARALRAVGELGRRSALDDLLSAFDSENEHCRFAASWSAALLGEPTAAEALWAVANHGGLCAERACDMAARAKNDHEQLRVLLSGQLPYRTAVAGVAALGRPESIDWLITCMESPDLARVAAGAFTQITGANLSLSHLEREPVAAGAHGPSDEADDEEVVMDPDDSLPWPDPAAVRRWWKQHAQRFDRSARYLLGRTIDEDSLQDVLRHGNQSARKAAAMELALLSPGKPLIEVRAPGFRQGALQHAAARAPELAADTVCVTALGMTSSLGGVVTACAAARADLSLATEVHDFTYLAEDGHERCAVGHVVPAASGFRGHARWIALGWGGLTDLQAQHDLSAVDPKQTGLFLCLPDIVSRFLVRGHEGDESSELPDPASLQTLGRRVGAQLLSLTRLQIPHDNCHYRFDGHAGVTAAIAEACTALVSQRLQHCLIGGVDSLVDIDTLGWLHESNRLKTEDRPDGLIPGEAAGFLLLERASVARARNADILATVAGACTAEEPHPLYSGDPPTGRGLSEALNRILLDSRNVQVISDLNGESYRATDWGHALVRLCQEHPHMTDCSPWYPVRSFGDVGAATGAVQTCVAIRAMCGGGTISIVAAASDRGARGATLLRIEPRNREHTE